MGNLMPGSRRKLLKVSGPSTVVEKLAEGPDNAAATSLSGKVESDLDFQRARRGDVAGPRRIG
jgi:hypothetical protein